MFFRIILEIIIWISICFYVKRIFENVNKIKKEYNESSYCKITHRSFREVFWDKGNYGEFLTYYELKSYEEYGNKFLFNIYIPKIDGETTELDLIMITKKGIIVFESKNYSGWIFGDKNSKYWMQVLPKGTGESYKTSFYNPIYQNKGHINNLKRILDENIPYFSIIVFSERCVLKKKPQDTNEIKVIHRNSVINAVRKIYDINPDIIDDKKICEIYNKLFVFSQVNDEVKKKHIQNIRNNH